MDKITIKNLKVFAYHGVNFEEKENGQNFYIDVDYFLDIKKACESDEIEDTVSYAKVVKTISAAFTKEKYNLIEKAAQAVANAIFDNFGAIYKVEITLKKPEAPVNAEFDYMAVTITRERE